MTSTVMKIESEMETCSVCGAGGELLTPEEHDASAEPMQVPLRTMLLRLNNHKVVAEGRFCLNCIRRTIEAYEFSTALSSKSTPPLSEKIRALRRRLHELTQKIDVFIVVGGPGVNTGGTYSEEDIIMVEKDVLAAAAAADDEDLERARNARGDTVYQCSVCPMSFQRVSEFRSHAATHPAAALHSCWTCGAQFPSRAALRLHAADHAPQRDLVCYLCDTHFQSGAELRRHGAACACAGACPLCGAACAGRGALAAHAAAAHGRGAPPPLLCPACFRRAPDAAALSAHLLRHRQADRFVCGYDGCILRFSTRGYLLAHIRRVHAAAAPATTTAAPTCDRCGRTFGSMAAMKRHARVHRPDRIVNQEEGNDSQLEGEGEVEGEEMEIEADGDLNAEGEIEYLEVETLEDIEYRE
ncbi:uncharacterized protein ACR2FA_008133 [Aphomia sociella]